MLQDPRDDGNKSLKLTKIKNFGTYLAGLKHKKLVETSLSNEDKNCDGEHVFFFKVFVHYHDFYDGDGDNDKDNKCCSSW